MKSLILLVFAIALVFWFYQCEPNKVSVNEIEFIKASNAFNNQQYDLAQTYYSNALMQNPENSEHPEYQLKLARSYILAKFQNINKAIESYKKFLSHQDLNLMINIDVISNMQAIGLNEMLIKSIPKISSNLLKASILSQDDPEIALNYLKLVPPKQQLSDFHILANKINFTLHKYNKVIFHSEKLISQGELNKNVYYIFSQSLLRTNQIADAKKATETYMLINSLETEINPVKKFQILNRLLDFDQRFLNNTDFKVLYFSILLKLDNQKQIQKYFNELNFSELSNKQVVRLLNAAQQGGNQFIIELLFKQTSLNNMSVNQATFFCENHVLHKNMTKAEQFCKKAKQLYPFSAPLNYWYGFSLLSQDKVLSAIENIETAIIYAPWINAWRIQLASAYLGEGKIMLAKNILAETLDPEDASIKQFKLKNGL